MIPWRDWQFWLVTLAALGGLWAVVRQLIPKRDRNEPPCSTCAVGTAAQATTQERSAPQEGDEPGRSPS